MRNEQKQMSLAWLKENVFPQWMTKGIDSKNGAFVESLSFTGVPDQTARRALVQARQIYSLIEATRLSILTVDEVTPLVEKAVGSLIQNYSLPSGAFIHSVDTDGKPVNTDVDLYTQAFVLFGLAQAYDVLRLEEIKHQAVKVLKYLNTERKLKAGGYSEIKNSQLLFQSNPHMHLFESALVWTKWDEDPCWRVLAIELYELCCSRFIDPTTGFLAEHFSENWQPQLESGRFIFEPGHQYEWAWLMIQFEKITGIKVGDRPQKLFGLAEKFGLSADQSLAYDEVFSDGQIKKNSSRFWPQCERIKAAAAFQQNAVADQAMQALFKNFMIAEGFWKDNTTDTSGIAKASSLYHIINAISEYVQQDLLYPT